MARNDEIRVRIIGDERDLNRRLDNVRKSTGRLETGFGKVGSAVKGFLGAAAVQQGLRFVADQFDVATEAASNLEQAVGGTKAVFGDASGAIDVFAQSADQSMGLSEAAFREGTTAIGAQIKRMTGDVNFAADESVNVLRIASDSAATFGGTTEEAVQALGAAFRGEADPAERFGFALNVTAVQAEAAERGLGDVKSGSEDYVRVLLDMIEEQARVNGAIGQFARETDTAAGQLARHQAVQENLNAQLGQSLGWWQQGKNAVGTWWAEVKLGTAQVNSWSDALGAVTGPGGLPELGRKAAESSSHIAESDAALGRVTETTKEAAEETIDLSDSMDALSESVSEFVDPVLNMSEAQIAFHEALDEATEAVKENGATLDINTEKGRANKGALDNIAESTWELVEAAKGAGAGTDKLTSITEQGRKKFIEHAIQMGKTREQARNLADAYGFTTRQSRELREQTEQARRKFIDHAGKMKLTRGEARELWKEYQKSGGETDRLRGKTDQARRKFIEAAEKMGITKDRARDLWREYGKIPKKVHTDVTADNKQAIRSINRTIEKLKGIPSVYELSIRAREPRGDGLGIFGISGLSGFGGGLLGISPNSAVGKAYSTLGRPGDVISGLRPGARTRSGNLSYHAQGRALDITPEIGIAHAIRAAYGSRTKELITPWRWLDLHNGRPHYYSAGVHADHSGSRAHIHWAMRHGGIMNRPGRVLVGEEGPEVLNLARADMVTPLNKLDKLDKFDKWMNDGLGVGDGMGWRPPAGYTRAVRELLNAARAGKPIFEDFSYRGMSRDVARFNDDIAARFARGHRGGTFTRASVTRALRSYLDTSPRPAGRAPARATTGRSGGDGGTTVIINVHVAGSVLSERDLVKTINKQLASGALSRLRR